jgi:hypothetical protein
MRPNRFCEKSIYWVLSYRDSPRKKLHELYRNGVVYGHTEDSWKWTLAQSTLIQKVGLETWLNNTDGPYGFDYWVSRNKK